jgi:hypothetical protein
MKESSKNLFGMIYVHYPKLLLLIVDLLQEKNVDVLEILLRFFLSKISFQGYENRVWKFYQMEMSEL